MLTIYWSLVWTASISWGEKNNTSKGVFLWQSELNTTSYELKLKVNLVLTFSQDKTLKRRNANCNALRAKGPFQSPFKWNPSIQAKKNQLKRGKLTFQSESRKSNWRQRSRGSWIRRNLSNYCKWLLNKWGRECLKWGVLRSILWNSKFRSLE
jgi:hypothetical protein